MKEGWPGSALQESSEHNTLHGQTGPLKRRLHSSGTLGFFRWSRGGCEQGHTQLDREYPWPSWLGILGG